MKLYITVCAVILAVMTGCGIHPVPSELSSAGPEIPDSFEHVWVMSSGWTGFMGVAVALTPERYYYWFYSDVVSASEPDYPITGDYTLIDGKLVLDASGSHLYSTTWIITNNGGRECLQAEREIDDFARLLIPDQNFTAKAPFRNQSQLKADMSDAGAHPENAGKLSD